MVCVCADSWCGEESQLVVSFHFSGDMAEDVSVSDRMFGFLGGVKCVGGGRMC